MKFKKLVSTDVNMKIAVCTYLKIEKANILLYPPKKIETVQKSGQQRYD